MNFSINSQIFAHELRLLAKIAAAKSTLPILGCVRLSVETATPSLLMDATDIEIGLRTTCPLIAAEAPGTLVLPAARLLALVEQFPNADVSLVLDGGGVKITCGAFRSRLQTFPVEDFPVLPEGPSPTTHPAIALNAEALRGLIGRTRYAVSEKAGQYFLQGALLTLADPVAALVATDTKRLAASMMPQNGGVAMRVVLPTKTLDVLAAQTHTGDLFLQATEKHLFFVCGQRTIISRQLEATFPSYERIIPRENTKSVIVDRFALAAALRRVALLSEEGQIVTLAVTPGALDISATAAQVGQADEQVEVQYEGEPVTMKINGQAILDTLEVSVHPAVTLAFKDARTALLILDGAHHFAVISPTA